MFVYTMPLFYKIHFLDNAAVLYHADFEHKAYFTKFCLFNNTFLGKLRLFTRCIFLCNAVLSNMTLMLILWLQHHKVLIKIGMIYIHGVTKNSRDNICINGMSKSKNFCVLPVLST